MPTPPRGRKSSGLCRERIVAAAMQIVEEGHELSFRRLGAALNVDPTAVYRYFATKDDLIRGMIDQVAEAVSSDWELTEDWRHDLRDMGLRLRKYYSERPHLARLAALRTAGAEHEFAVVDKLIRCLNNAGLYGRDAARTYRCLTTLWFSYVVAESVRAGLDPQTREADQALWMVDYRRLGPDLYPALAAVSEHVPPLDEPSIFEDLQELVLAGIAQRIRDRSESVGAS